MNEESEPSPEDQPAQPSPEDPFMPIVESLLGRPLDSPEFLDACQVAGPAEIAEARRQIRQTLRWEKEAQAKVRQRMEELLAEYPELADEDAD